LEVAGKGEEVTRSAVVVVGEGMASEVDEEEVELLHLEEEVRILAGRVSAFREKGLDYFTSRAADLNPGKRRRDSSNGHTTQEEEAGEEENLTAEEREEEEKWTSEIQSLKDRLVVANEALPPLLKEIESWKEKLEAATKMIQKDMTHLGLTNDEDTIASMNFLV
jgi:transposase